MVVLRLLLLCALLPITAQAAWFQGTGTAPVINGNEDTAKEQAGRLALRDAILQAGASVSLVNDVEAGAISSNTFQVRANGHVIQIQKLEEYSKDDRITVTLRADIWNDSAVCENQHLTSKSIVMIPIEQADSQYASYGGFGDFSQAVTDHLYSEFDQAKADFLAKKLLPQSIAVDPERMSNDDIHQLQYLSETSQSQYIVMGKIVDIGLGRVSNGVLSSDKLVRNFAIELALIDGISGLPIMRKTYETRTYWPFEINTRVSSHSSQLWQSDYGLEVTRLLKNAVVDMSELLKCARPKSRIIRVGTDTLEVAMGARQGIKIGDVFKLQYQYNYADVQGQRYANFTDEPVEFEVVKVYPDHAHLIPMKNNYMPLGIQIRDVVQLDSFWD